MMSAPTTRDRRAPLFGGPTASQGPSSVDLESLERQNDDGIAALGERVGLLKNITGGIHSEVETQHRVLDGMSLNMAGLQMGLGASVEKFRKVMSEPHGRRTVYLAGGGAILLFLLYVWFLR